MVFFILGTTGLLSYISSSGGLDSIRTYLPSDTSIQGKIKITVFTSNMCTLLGKKGSDDDCVY
jgi:hypothetical protein